jgi:stress-induced morphogen
MVYEALAEMMPSDIHALIIEAISPDDEDKPRKP